MSQLLAFVLLHDHGPVTNPGNNGPIQPTGGNEPDLFKKHAVGFLAQATSSQQTVLLGLADLRIVLPSSARPDGARIVVYHGKGQVLKPKLPLVQTTDLVPDGAARRFKIAENVIAAASSLVTAGNTIGIEVNARLTQIPIGVSSVKKFSAAKPAKRKTHRKPLKTKTLRKTR